MTKLKDLTGQSFHKLTAVRRDDNDSSGRSRWLCQCECGRMATVSSYQLIDGGTKSCGCLRNVAHNKIDATGTRFGMLVAIQFDRAQSGQSYWLCMCDCGQTASVALGKLRSGETKSCGCLRAQVSAERMTTHGMAGKGRTGTYRSWDAMKQRCTNSNYSEFYLYGGRGIKVCDRWLLFDNFLEDMGVRPEGTSIDRIDVNGNYTKDNCRWATATEQAKNKRHHDKDSSD